ncbi:heterokaryon incompatibility protein domain-containing protein [Trichoderma ceciliae]
MRLRQKNKSSRYERYEKEFYNAGGHCGIGAHAYAILGERGEPALRFEWHKGQEQPPEPRGLYRLVPGAEDFEKASVEIRERERQKTLSDTYIPQFTSRFMKIIRQPDDSLASESHEPVHEDRSGTFFLLLQEWVKDCDEHHSDHANLFLKDPELPTRILDVRSGCLRHSEKGECGRYIALSHRWGINKIFRLEKNNIAELVKDMKIDRLPKTYQDAIKVTRQLGIQFIWIDSLCIIQDDPDDWEREAKRMEGVFALAYCTLAATSAEDSTAGFLDRPSHRKCVGPRSVDKRFHRDVEEGILNQRAWVLQERALSPRIIHFTKTQTYWECGSVVRAECLVHSFKKLSWLGDSHFPQTASRLNQDLSNCMFEDIFTKYSGLGITKLEDRPVAILGLESRLANFYNTRSVYGIFLNMLHRSLLWKRSGSSPMQPIDFHHKVVPSWSWMACAGEIQYGHKSDWHRAVGTTLDGDITLDPQTMQILAPVGQISPALDIDQMDESLSDNGSRVGWIRFDCKNEYTINELSCIVAGHGTACWNDYAGTNWGESLLLNDYYYLILVVPTLGEKMVIESGSHITSPPDPVLGESPQRAFLTATRFHRHTGHEERSEFTIRQHSDDHAMLLKAT